jgi:hypothetical protein
MAPQKELYSYQILEQVTPFTGHQIQPKELAMATAYAGLSDSSLAIAFGSSITPTFFPSDHPIRNPLLSNSDSFRFSIRSATFSISHGQNDTPI